MSINIKNLSKSFGEKSVLNSINTEIQDGEVLAIMGASGCGKTTLLKIIAGIINPDGGNIFGVPKKLSMVFQEDRLSEEFSAVSNIKAVTGRSVSKSEIKSHLKQLGLENYTNTAVKTLSGGMKRRVSIARAVLYRCDLVIMDEPFKGLDEELKISVMNYVKENTKDRTFIFVTHDKSEAEYMNAKILSL